MKEIFKEFITNFHKSQIPVPISRGIIRPTFSEDVRKALVFIGMRRSGKTWAMYHIMQDLFAQEVDITKMLYLNFEDERLSDMQKNDFQDILNAYFELYPEYIHAQDIHFFFDEIHEIDGWQKFIRRLLDQEKMHIYITGSSCKMLSKEIASSLRGRTFVQEIFPFSFSEYLKKVEVVVPQRFATKDKSVLIHHARNFLQSGGFAEVINQPPQIHRKLLQDYLGTVLYRDIIDRYKISNVHALKQLLSHCVRNSASLFSVNKMYNSLKSLGFEISKNALYEYMDYFEDASCIFSVDRFDLSHRKATQSVKKVYAVDQGLITAVSMAIEFDLAAQLETAVFSYLRRQSPHVFYYKTADNTEVDFLMILPDQTMHLFQACVSMKEPNTRQREVRALVAAMQELELNSGTIITLEEQEDIETEAGTIQVMPAWKALL